MRAPISQATTDRVVKPSRTGKNRYATTPATMLITVREWPAATRTGHALANVIVRVLQTLPAASTLRIPMNAPPMSDLTDETPHASPLHSGFLLGGALAQNTKGTGAETRTTTTTNPEASMGLPTPSDEVSHAARPSGTDRPNMKATKSATQPGRPEFPWAAPTSGDAAEQGTMSQPTAAAQRKPYGWPAVNSIHPEKWGKVSASQAPPVAGFTMQSLLIVLAKIFAGPLEARFPPKYLVDRRGQAARQAPSVTAFVSMLLKEDVVMRTYDFSPLFRSTVGFDRLFDMLDNGARRTGRPTTSKSTGKTSIASAWPSRDLGRMKSS